MTVPGNKQQPLGVFASKRLGDVLTEKALITQEQLQLAITKQKQMGKKLGATLVELGFLTHESLAGALAYQLHLPMVQIRGYSFNENLIKLLPQTTARRLQALVLEDKGGSLLVTVADPVDLHIYDELVRILQRDVLLAVSPVDQIQAALDRVYRRTEEITGFAKQLEKDVGEAFSFSQFSIGQDGGDDAPVVRLLQSVFEDAMQVGASDIHVEPMESSVNIRFRIDGILHLQNKADKRIANALAQRLKLMGNLDISERRQPQDGRFNITIRGQVVDVRMSTLPSQFGESVVMRLLRQATGVSGLDTIGLPEAMLARLRVLLVQGNGMILVTGPTGSGKTTTLYSILGALNTKELKVLTVEDPIEYRLPGVIQSQINEKIDFTFSKVLRAALRQDPDVLLVGEIRDQETADIALRSAITGHMVLSTLHTKDAASTPLRLFDMGIAPYMISTSLQAVLAQRLVRLNCELCSRPVEPTPGQRQWLTSLLGQEAGMALTQKVGAGCPSCNHTGYLGRTGVYEMFEMDSELMELAATRNLAEFSKKAYRKMTNKTLVHHALELVSQGRTSLLEANKVAQHMDQT